MCLIIRPRSCIVVGLIGTQPVYQKKHTQKTLQRNHYSKDSLSVTGLNLTLMTEGCFIWMSFLFNIIILSAFMSRCEIHEIADNSYCGIFPILKNYFLYQIFQKLSLSAILISTLHYINNTSYYNWNHTFCAVLWLEGSRGQFFFFK